MLPSTFVFLNALPLTPNGKVDRKALPSPERETGELPIEQEATTPQEEVLLGLWRKVLGHRQMGIHDNFFELGGHSLLMIQLLTRIRTILGVEVPLRTVFEAPTVAKLTQRIELLRAGTGNETLPLRARERPAVLPLSFAQQRLWFLDRFAPASTAYLIANVFPIQEKIRGDILEHSLQELINRHESLRTTFEERDGQPFQVIHPTSRTTVRVIDLQGVPQEHREPTMLHLAWQEAHHPCDLTQGPLMRLSMVRFGEQEQVLLLTLHHIITDLWSNEILLQELVTLYQAFAQGEPSPLSPLPIQYADYALWQRQWLQGEVLETQIAYWTRRLGGAPSLELPADYPRPAVASNQGAKHAFALSKELSHALRGLAQQEEVTSFMLLLAAFQVLFYRLTGQEDIVMGTDSANRHRGQTEGIIGFFVNVLVLRTDLSGKPAFREVLQRVREGALGAYAHQDLPFDLLVEKLASERYLDRNPLVQVLFVLQNTHLEREHQAEAVVQDDQEMAPPSSRDPLNDEETAAKFDLALFMHEREGRLSGILTYRQDLFTASTIAAMMTHFEILLQHVVTHPDLPINLLEYVSTEEQRQRQQEEQKQRPEVQMFNDGWLDLSASDFTRKNEEKKR